MQNLAGQITACVVPPLYYIFQSMASINACALSRLLRYVVFTGHTCFLSFLYRTSLLNGSHRISGIATFGVMPFGGLLMNYIVQPKPHWIVRDLSTRFRSSDVRIFSYPLQHYFLLDIISIPVLHLYAGTEYSS
jgi:hypothetical protein